MRRFFPAMEEEEVLPPTDAVVEGAEGAVAEGAEGEVAAIVEEPVGDENISLEEEQLMLDDAASDDAEATADLAEAERIIEVSDGLEDLAVVADNVEEASPEEAQLIELAGDMAVAGTDVEAEQVVPAMESFIGGKIDTAAIKARAKKIWEEIQKFVASIWERIETFFYNTIGTIPALKKRLAAMEEKVKGLQGNAKEATFAVSGSVAQALNDGAGTVANGAELTAAIDKLTAAEKYVFGQYLPFVTGMGDTIVKGMNAFDPAKAQESAAAFITELMGKKAPAMPGQRNGGDMFPGYKTTIGESLLGNVRLALKEFAPKEEGTDAGAKMDRVRKSGLVLAPTLGKAKVDTKDFKTLTPAEMQKVLGQLKPLLADLENYQRGEAKKIAATRKTLEAASKKASDEMGKVDEAKDGRSTAYYRSLLNFNVAYAGWVKSPAAELLKASLTSVKAAMYVVDKSAAQYGKAEEAKAAEPAKA